MTMSYMKTDRRESWRGGVLEGNPDASVELKYILQQVRNGFTKGKAVAMETYRIKCSSVFKPSLTSAMITT